LDEQQAKNIQIVFVALEETNNRKARKKDEGEIKEVK